tara:strand:- start:1165 stop:1875 length:711 start_codon:yes stop_codon:yes gene_type:complete
MAKSFREYKDLYLPVAIIAAALIVGGSLIYTAGMGEDTTGTERVAQGNGTVPSPDLVKNNGSTVEFTITEQDHVRGNLNAKITLVEFSDLQCLFCASFHPSVQQALAEYGDDIRWVYKHFPLDTRHPQARPAAEASECVWEQKGDEGFWQFADAIFENQSRMNPSYYQEVAQQIGVNLAQFDTCVSERKYQDKVEADYQAGLQAGVAGTPGSYVNGVPVRGAVPYEQLKSIIDSQL